MSRLATLLVLGLLGLSATACFDQEAGHQAAAAAPAGPITVTVVAAGRTAAGAPPRIMLLADGAPAGQADVTASREADQWGSYSFTLPGPAPKTLSIRYLNDAGERDVWIRKLVLADRTLKPEESTYRRDGRPPMPGRGRMSWPGELQFAL